MKSIDLRLPPKHDNNFKTSCRNVVHSDSDKSNPRGFCELFTLKLCNLDGLNRSFSFDSLTSVYRYKKS